MTEQGEALTSECSWLRRLCSSSAYLGMRDAPALWEELSSSVVAAWARVAIPAGELAGVRTSLAMGAVMRDIGWPCAVAGAGGIRSFRCSRDENNAREMQKRLRSQSRVRVGEIEPGNICNRLWGRGMA